MQVACLIEVATKTGFTVYRAVSGVVGWCHGPG